MIKRFKTHLTSTLLIASWLLAACAPAQAPAQAPSAAIDELNARWESLPGSQTHDLVILRAWQGRTSSDAGAPPASTEIWCMETKLVPKSGPKQTTEPTVWIVTRSGADAEWVASPLMVMSSIWPYQACLGHAP